MANQLADRIARLEDIEAIRNLIEAYGPLADAGDAAGVAALWSETGEYDVGGFGIAKGREEIAALINSDTHGALMDAGCAHILSPHHITLEGDRAEAVGYSQVLRRSEDGSFAIRRASWNRWQLQRQEDGQWLVEHRLNRPIGPTD